MIKLARFRKSQGKSLRRLGRDAGVSLATVQRIEADEYDPRLSTLRRLAKALNVSLASLMGASPEKGAPITTPNQRMGKRMITKDDFKTRNAAVDDAIRGLEDWRRKHLTKALYNNGKQWGIWD